MFYFKCSSFADRGDNIKTNRNIYTEMLDICIGSHYNVAYFLPINGILRFDVFRIASCLHFHYNQQFIFDCHNVQFQMVFAPITVENDISIAFQIRYCGVFSIFSKGIVCCHTCIYPYFSCFYAKIRFFCFVFTEVKLILQ